MNFRIAAAKEILKGINAPRVLDVGCRNCEAREIFDHHVNYQGNDLFQNESGSVTYVGDILAMEFDRQYDCVMALDIIEHVDQPHALMEKLIGLTENYLLVSLPNVFDLTHKFQFVFGNTLGGKYKFGLEDSLDRHRWVMNYDEIQAFLAHYAKKHSMQLVTHNLRIGLNAQSRRWRMGCALLSPFVDEKHLTGTVMALFSKRSGMNNGLQIG